MKSERAMTATAIPTEPSLVIEECRSARREAAEGRQRPGRLLAGRELGQQLGGGVEDLGDGALECLVSPRRRLLYAAHLPYVLPGGRLDLLRRRLRLQAPQGRDVPAHGFRGYGVASPMLR